MKLKFGIGVMAVALAWSVIPDQLMAGQAESSSSRRSAWLDVEPELRTAVERFATEYKSLIEGSATRSKMVSPTWGSIGTVRRSILTLQKMGNSVRPGTSCGRGMVVRRTRWCK